jgi:hypothetical protein
MKVEDLVHRFCVTEFGEHKVLFEALTQKQAIEWIASRIRADLLGRVEYEIHETYGND